MDASQILAWHERYNRANRIVHAKAAAAIDKVMAGLGYTPAPDMTVAASAYDAAAALVAETAVA